jgi:outer membrane protein insertion porin family
LACVTEKFMIINKRLIKIFLRVSLLILLLIPQVHAQELKKFVVMPFEINSKAVNSDIKKTLYLNLSSELKKEKNIQVLPTDELLSGTIKIDEKFVINKGKALGADFVVMGSLTQFGDTINIDAKIIDIPATKVLPSVSVQGKSSEGMGVVAARVKTEILTRTGLIQKVAKVEIKGNRKIEAIAIMQQIKSKTGKPFSETDIADDIKTIFKMGFFQDVTADVTEVAEGKVISFIVVEKGLITEIRINGNKELSTDDINNVLTIKTRQTLNQEKIKSDIEKVKILYDSKGYFNTEITDRVEKDGEKDFRIVLDIKENDRLYVKLITFEGNEAYSSKELKNMMTQDEYTIFHIFTDSGLLKRDVLKQDIAKLNAFYFNNGFINALVGEPEITNDAKGIYINIKVNEGKRFKVGKVEISGDLLDKPRAELFQSLRIKEGNNYDRDAIMKDMEFLTQSCNDEGYANADVNPKIDTEEKGQVVAINYQINKGSLVYINHITIFGNTVTRDKVIRRQVALIEGALYSSSKLKASYNNLGRLRYFEEVDFQTEKGPDKTKVDVNIRVKEKNTGMFMVGAGYSANDQAMLMAQITQQNFLGLGQTLSLKASLGSTTNMYDISFTEPWLFDIPLYFQYNIWKYTKQYDSFNQDTTGTGFSFGYPVWEKISASLGYQISITNIQGVNFDTAPWYIIGYSDPQLTSIVHFVNDFNRTLNSSVTASLGRDTTDDNIFPSKGTRSSISIQQAGGIFGGDVNFTKYFAALFAYYPLPLDLVFAAKGRVGYIDSHNKDIPPPYDVPFSDRYILGGISSVRGLRYIGIENPGTVDALGGTSMLNFNLEIVFPFLKDAGMKGVVFYDAGNVWDGHYHLFGLRNTVGAGIRWYSPIGPLRVEYGYVLDRQTNEPSGRIEFTIGMMM